MVRKYIFKAYRKPSEEYIQESICIRRKSGPTLFLPLYNTSTNVVKTSKGLFIPIFICFAVGVKSTKLLARLSFDVDAAVHRCFEEKLF